MKMKMNERLPEKIINLTPYKPVSGEFSARLNANESFITQDNGGIFSRLSQIELNRYPDPYAEKTCKAFGEFYGVSPENVTAGNGSDELISIIVSCFLNKGDKILCFEPDFSMYFFYPKLYELDVKIIQKKDDFTIDIDGAIDYCKANDVKCVMLSNPCNPTSVGISGSEIERLVKNVSALVIVDEAYMEFWENNQSLLDKINVYDNLIVLKTCSKALGLAGIRLGFAVADKTITNALRAVKSPYNVNIITQEIGALVLSDKQLVTKRIAEILSQKQSLLEELDGLNLSFFEKIYNSAANFFFIKAKNTEEVYNSLLQSGVAISRFKEYLRITCGNIKENKILIEELQKMEENLWQ